ncbi:potassium channel subfamily K member 16-like [Latimeria chalumnae]|uniref:potassium channel subfamily K member 16-like n=1 Tax=Latimeria chalumnae TaxID=7897 RepID=UPI0003C1151C|nr:PREDICTED: potassium channel subfamily K member 16-like [Latimeria chalumnae]|eukprot:XP_005986568.1 PREDICTED: potassium channel subfamily K member 16-like [Latimeria chalumnae]
MALGWLHPPLLVALYLSYLLVGAAVFQALEQSAEKAVKKETYHRKLAFLTNYTCLSPEAVERFVKVITEALKHGINPVEDIKLLHSNWDFSSSLFFVGSVVTTIGYGSKAPKTVGGQIFCVFFALFGIPLNIFFLGHTSKVLISASKKLGDHLFQKRKEERLVKILTIIFFLVMGFIMFFLLPPFVFTITEGWSYMEGVYFAFITLSTIGFGDYVIGINPYRNYLIGYRSLAAVWIIFGLSWLALLFNLLTAFLKDTEEKITSIHKKKKSTKTNENDATSLETANCIHEEEEGGEREGDDDNQRITVGIPEPRESPQEAAFSSL